MPAAHFRPAESNLMSSSRLIRACWAAFALMGLVVLVQPAAAQSNFDRPGGDYSHAQSLSGDPADCALTCERDRRCRAWSFSYPADTSENGVCWLKDKVPGRVESFCCVSGVRGAGVIEPRTGPVEISIDRFGGDYKNFELKTEDKTGTDEQCRKACEADNKCRAWTYARPGYTGKGAHCFLKSDIKPPRRKPGFISGVVR
jgi:hypothetical protein